MRIAVISDIHANGRALVAARSDIERESPDLIVVLGDILTYGVDVQQVLAGIHDIVASGGILVMGNHDEMYIQLGDGNADYYRRLPDWIRESVDFSRARFSAEDFRLLPWVYEYEAEGMLFAHANPFGPRDWTYLNSDALRVAARSRLASRGLSLGVFGHTHRAFTDFSPNVRLANPGSIGQPRDALGTSTWLLIDYSAEAATLNLKPVTYDVLSHVSGLRNSGLSGPTSERLVSFFQMKGSPD